MESREERLRRVLSSNKPYYRQTDMEPPMAGKSVLHNENGIPKVRPQRVIPSSELPDIRESTERVVIRGSDHHQDVSVAALSKPDLNPRRSSKHVEEADTIPDLGSDLPIHVGHNVDHRWYDDHVTGVDRKSREEMAKEYIDNEFVHTDALQGMDPLDDYPVSIPPSPDVREQMKSEASESLKEDVPHSIFTVGVGVYCVYVNDDFIYASDSESNIIECVEDIMLNHGIDRSFISVYKRVDISFGITLKQ